MADAIDDGLIKALERLERNFDLLLAGKPVRDVEETKAEVRRVLSKHKAPLSVRHQVERDKEAFASLSPGEQQAAREELHSIGQNPGVEFAPLSVAGDDVERLPPTDSGDDLRLRIAKAISIPQHHTTWDILSEMEKDLFLMQADYVLSALQVTEGDKS